MQLQPKEYISLCGDTNVKGMMHMVAKSTSVVLKCSTKCFTWDMDSIEDVFVESSTKSQGIQLHKRSQKQTQPSRILSQCNTVTSSDRGMKAKTWLAHTKSSDDQALPRALASFFQLCQQ